MWGTGTGMSQDCKARWGKFLICDIELYQINWIELNWVCSLLFCQWINTLHFWYSWCSSSIYAKPLLETLLFKMNSFLSFSFQTHLSPALSCQSLLTDCWLVHARKVHSHQKRNYFFARPNPMKSQHTDACGCHRRDIFLDGAFGAFRAMRYGRRDVGDVMWATHLQRRNFHPELKYFNFEAVISQLGPISVALEAEVFQT